MTAGLDLHHGEPTRPGSRLDEPPVDLGAVTGVWSLAWRVALHRPREFWIGWALFVVFFTMPAISGYLLAQGYRALEAGDTTATIWWAAAIAASETVRMVAIHHGALIWTRVWIHMQTLLRANMLSAQMASGGVHAGQPIGSAGSAITHFRDDTEDVANLVDGIVDISGGVVFTVIAGFVLGAADARAAAILVIPLFGVGIATRVLDSRIKAYRAADRVATEHVTGLLGDVMAAATTVKVNDASEPMLRRLAVLVARRRHTAVRDRVLEEGVQAFSQGAADIGLGLVLLVSATAIASGAFDLGTLALFTAYLGWLSFLPRMVGRVLARRKQAGVAFDRMRQLVAEREARNTVRPRSLPIDPRDHRVRPGAQRPERVRLERFEVESLRVAYGDRVVVDDVDLVIERGEFVVITGPVGAGKSTLLRAVLGLAWQADVTGSVRWNGQEIADRAAFLVPPNAAFLSQVPQLISDSVADNVGLGPVDPARLATALHLAAIDADIAAMPAGAATLIGPRGLRLSGGQRQRLATARALVHDPELVVLDDLSSALDVETEVRLWTNMADAGMTVIAVSHRAVAFDRADQVLRLERGRLVR
ncbi:MAG TPA: ABC transporter ATP-binding protein [Ilumatobacteraceae bacterium]|nr:ABC transporter ATP-binding protein [Ilumatobacteraceae bacterium]